MLARIKALKEEEEAKAKAAGKVVAPSVDVPKKAANKTKVTPIKQPSLGAVTTKNAAMLKLKKGGKTAKVSAKSTPPKRKRRRREGALGKCIRGWKRYCKKHGKGYAITTVQLLVFLSTLVAVYFAFASQSGCTVTNTRISSTSDGVGDGFLRCMGRYGGYFQCKDGDTNWKCVRRFNLCIPHSWSIGFFKDKDCIDFDDAVSPSRVRAPRIPHVYNSNFSRSDGTFVDIKSNMYFPKLGQVGPLALPDTLSKGLSTNAAGTANPIPQSYLEHDYFFGIYTFALVVGNNPEYQFSTVPIMKCQQISYKLDDETTYTNYIYVDGWCEEGEVQEETHQRADPRIELYIEIPRNTGGLG